jgi:hypothetical protein
MGAPIAMSQEQREALPPALRKSMREGAKGMFASFYFFDISCLEFERISHSSLSPFDVSSSLLSMVNTDLSAQEKHQALLLCTGRRWYLGRCMHNRYHHADNTLLAFEE